MPPNVSLLILNLSLGVGAEKLSRKELKVAARQIGLGSSNEKRIILTLEEIAMWLAKNVPRAPKVQDEEFSRTLSK